MWIRAGRFCLPAWRGLAFAVMIPDSVHLLTRSSRMTLYKMNGAVRRALLRPELHQRRMPWKTPRMLTLSVFLLADSVTELPNASGSTAFA